jgi:hypothetical protein
MSVVESPSHPPSGERPSAEPCMVKKALVKGWLVDSTWPNAPFF